MAAITPTATETPIMTLVYHDDNTQTLRYRKLKRQLDTTTHIVDTWSVERDFLQAPSGVVLHYQKIFVETTVPGANLVVSYFTGLGVIEGLHHLRPRPDSVTRILAIPLYDTWSSVQAMFNQLTQHLADNTDPSVENRALTEALLVRALGIIN